ncbi:MAG TPA: STAS domain-containing protein [Humisphaera sp.]
MHSSSVIPEVLRAHQQDLLTDWMQSQRSAAPSVGGRISEADLRRESEEFLRLLTTASAGGRLAAVDGPEWQPVRQYLEDLSRSRATLGYTSDETATFVFSFKRPLFDRLARHLAGDAAALAAETWAATELLDRLGLQTVRAFQTAREGVIKRQQEELLELSTPVVKLWDGVLALPLIGTLDSARTQVVMESLLQRIVDTGAAIAIIDITGVPTVDTLVAQHLLKTVTAIRLMGADSIISGVRPQIAQTIVHLGVDLQGVTTKANLSDALALALRRTGFAVTRPAAATVAASLT